MAQPLSHQEQFATPMDRRLLAAATTGDTIAMQDLASHDPAVLLGTTPQRDTCLHISCIYGHEGFCKDVLTLNQCLPLLAATNADDETPLLAAVARGRAKVASILLRFYRDQHLRDAILMQDKRGFNALQHAISRGLRELALELIEAEPALSKSVNKWYGSPMFNAVMIDNGDVFGKLLEIRDAADGGARGYNALHAAVTTGNAVMAKRIMEARPLLVRQKNKDKRTPMLVEVADDTTSTSSSKGATTKSSGAAAMDKRLLKAEKTGDTIAIRPQVMMDRLLEAAVRGHVAEMRHLYLHVPGVLVGTTPLGNTCLHIAAIHGHEVFCNEAQALNPSLLAAVNSDGETPLLAAVASSRVSVASVLLRCCRNDQQRSKTILKQKDKRGCNALHHATRSGHRELALELIAAEPALSKAVNKYGESPMFIAVMRNDKDVFEKLLEIPDSAYRGTNGNNALHAAVRNGNSAIAKGIMETRPALATEQSRTDGNTPLQLVVLWDKIDVLRVLLEHDRSLGYVAGNNKGVPLLIAAAYRGHVGVAQELLKHCPDAPFTRTDGWTCLHEAVWSEHPEFVDFVLGLPQFGRLINMRDQYGNTALHLAVNKCNPKMVAALLLHPDIDVTVLNGRGVSAIWELEAATDHSKTLNWNEISMLMLKADPKAATDIYNLRKHAQHEVTNTTRKVIKTLTQTYTANTSLVAILIATITFAAAFTLPGGYSTDAGNEGLPIMARKFAFKTFLVSDTLAMCSSLVVAFVCIIARWEDLEFLLHYRSFTKKLMWFAYMATTTAFATGLYTVLAPHLLWLAITVCILTSLLPFLTKLLGGWPILKLRFRLGGTFNSELLDMV